MPLMTQYDTATSRKQQEDKGVRWSEEGVLNDTNTMRERDKGISPPEPWRLLCSIHQQAWGEKLNMFSI